MEALIRFSLRQKIFFNLLFILLTVTGFLALSELPNERYPNFNFGEVVISTYYPGASPSEVETLVTRELEETLETVDNIDWIKATSYPQRSHIRLKFIDDSDYETLFNEVRFKILNSINELPDEIDPPVISDISVNDYLPVIVVNLGGKHSNRGLALMAEQLKPALNKIHGVKEVIINGEFVREFHIQLDPDKLRRFGVSFNEVASILQKVNVSIPAGTFRHSQAEFLIKVDEKFHNRSQVVNTIIRRDGDGNFTRLEDLISNAQLSYRDPLVISSVNGQDVVALKIIKSEQGNSLAIKADVETVLKNFESLFKQEKLAVTLTQDSTVKINDGLSTLGLNMLIGMSLVSLVIWYFMGIRNAGLVTIGIPFSFMVTMLLMYLTGNSLNELTLFSFVLVTGIIVDDAIVVSENIYRHVQEGEETYHAIVKGTAEVALPVIASTLTTMAAFLPMLIMTGTTGDFFALIPTAVSYALLASLIECLIILPIHYLDFGPKRSKKLSTQLVKDDWLLAKVRSLTATVLNFTMHYRLFSVSIVMLLLAVVIGILIVSATGTLPLLKIKFFPDDYSLYYVDIKAPAETPKTAIDKRVRDISQLIMADGESYASSTSGFAGMYFNDDYEAVHGNNFGTVVVVLPARQQQAFEDPLQHLQNMRDKLKQKFEHEGYRLYIHAQKDGPPTGKDINVRIMGTNIEAINGLADRLWEFMQNNEKVAPYLVELTDNRGQARRIYRFEVLHERVNEYQLDSGAVATFAGSVLDGRYIGKYRLSDEEIDLKLMISPHAIPTPESALTLPFIEHARGSIRLGDVAQLRSYQQNSELHRYQGQRAISIKANLKPESATSSPAIIYAINEFYQSIKSDYSGVNLVFDGEHEDTQRSYQSLAYAFIIAVMIMYIILAAQFQSYLQPVIILSAIIFALIGVVFGKLITQSVFTVNSFIAVIGVAGVVVNDSLMLIDFINKSYQKGLSRRAAIDEGIRIRLRPIILTTITTTLGLLPMALGIPQYSPVWGAMASTFVTGLATATLLTLFIVPVLWDLVQARQEKKLHKLKGNPLS